MYFSLVIRRPYRSVGFKSLLNIYSATRTKHFSNQPIMKRKASESPEPSSRKAPKPSDYCDVPCKRDANGNQVWPAPESQMEAAKEFLKEWYTRRQ